MRYFLLLFFCSLSIFINAQDKVRFYDYNWKPSDSYNASFYSKIKNTDSGWLRTDYYLFSKKAQMVGLFEDSSCKIKNGNIAYYHANGNMSFCGRYEYNRPQGTCLNFYSNGNVEDSAVYKKGSLQGAYIHWHLNGLISDSLFRDEAGLYKSKSWFDNGKISSIGDKVQGKMQGEWKFFDRDGKLTSVESYEGGRLLSRTYFDANGKALSDTTNTDSGATFTDGDKGWKKYIRKKLYWPEGYHFTKGNNAVVVIKWTINENGEVVDPEIDIPFNPAFDLIALDIIKKSPKWNAAKSHNRRISSTRRFAVEFAEDDF